MEYRDTTPEDDGFADADEQYAAMRDYVGNIMATTDPVDIMDTLLIMANVCETRALWFDPMNPALATWYRTTAKTLRGCLTLLSRERTAPKPNRKFEDPLLYFPDLPVSN